MKNQQTETKRKAFLLEEKALERLTRENLEEFEEIDYKDFPILIDERENINNYWH